MTAAEAAKVREEQRQSNSSGVTLTRAQAMQRVEQKDLQQGNVTKLFAEQAKLKADLVATQKELADMRITGVGFSGKGPQGIMFTQDALSGGGSGTDPVTLPDMIVVLNGTAYYTGLLTDGTLVPV